MKNRIDSLQAVRALAFLGIFMSHSGIRLFSAGGAWGVSVFLILSGFLMTYSYYGTERIRDSGLGFCVRFGIGKIRKLYPLHIVTMLMALPYLIGGYAGYTGLGRLLNPTAKILTNSLLIQSWIPRGTFYGSLNAVSWYLSTSLFLYMAFPLVLSRMRKYRGARPAIAVIAALCLLQLVLAWGSWIIQSRVLHSDDWIHWFTYIFPLSRLEDFVIGCNLGYLFLHRGKEDAGGETRFTLLELAAIVLIVALMAVYVPHVSTENWWGYTVLWTLSSCALVYLFALGRGKLSALLTNRVTLWIAKLSAYCFLIHQMIYRYLNSVEGALFGRTEKTANLVICFGITMLLAYGWDRLTGRRGRKVRGE